MTKVASPSASKRDRTREKLIEAATSVIAEKGFDRASLEEIAARLERVDGRTAVALAKQHSPDIVLMDITMPDLNAVYLGHV